MWVRARAASSKRTVSLISSMVPSIFGDESINAGENCQKPMMWSNCSVFRVLAPSARVLVSSLTRIMCFFLPCATYSEGNKLI